MHQARQQLLDCQMAPQDPTSPSLGCNSTSTPVSARTRRRSRRESSSAKWGVLLSQLSQQGSQSQLLQPQLSQGQGSWHQLSLQGSQPEEGTGAPHISSCHLRDSGKSGKSEALDIPHSESNSDARRRWGVMGKGQAG